MSMTEMNFTIPSSISADKVSYSNTSSGLTSTDVQSAIDEVNNSKFGSPNKDGIIKNPFNVTGAITVGTVEYTAPSDGTLALIAWIGNNSWVEVYFDQVTTSADAIGVVGGYVGIDVYYSSSFIVKKGTKIVVNIGRNGSSSTNLNLSKFIPSV